MSANAAVNNLCVTKNDIEFQIDSPFDEIKQIVLSHRHLVITEEHYMKFVSVFQARLKEHPPSTGKKFPCFFAQNCFIR